MTLTRLYGYIPTTRTLLGYVPMGSLTGEERERLYAQPMPWERPTPGIVKKASAVEKALSAGNSTIWTGTGSLTEIARCRIDRHQWRDSGVLKIFVTGRFTNSAGAGTETITFDLSRAVVPPNEVGDASFGQVQAFSSLLTWTTPAMAAGAGTGMFGMEINIAAEGHQSSAWTYLLSGLSTQTILPGTTIQPGYYSQDLTLDPTADFDLKLQFKHDASPNGTTKQFDVWSAHMGLLFPADGSVRG